MCCLSVNLHGFSMEEMEIIFGNMSVMIIYSHDYFEKGLISY